MLENILQVFLTGSLQVNFTAKKLTLKNFTERADYFQLSGSIPLDNPFEATRLFMSHYQKIIDKRVKYVPF